MLPKLTRLLTILTLLWLPCAGALAQDPDMDPGNFEIPELEGFDDFNEGDFGAPPMSAEDQAAAAALGFGMMIFVFLMSLVGLVLTALVAYLMMDALNAVPESFQQLQPWVPWLLFVPLVNLVVIFLVFLKVPDSLSTYLQSVGNTSQGDCGKNLGLWGCILYILGCTFPIGLVLLIMSILKINQAKKVAQQAAVA
jgi:magnesium-transporting ATPase (P-type)